MAENKREAIDVLDFGRHHANDDNNENGIRKLNMK